MCNEPRRKAPQDDLPYEQRMYYIIRDYRRMFYERENVVAYVNKLKRRIVSLEKDRAERILKIRRIAEISTERNREIKRLKAHIEWLKERYEKQIAEIKRRQETT